MGEHDATAGAREAGEHQRNGPPAPGGPRQAGGGHGRAGAAGAALAVIAVAGTAIGAALLRPDGSLLAKSGGPLDNTAVVVLIAVASLAAGLLLSSRYRASLGYEQILPPFEQRLADAVRVTLIAAAVLVPALLLSMHRFPQVDATPPPPAPTRDRGLPHTPPPVPTHPLGKPGHAPRITLPHILVLIGIAALVIALLVAGYLLWQQLRRAPVRPDAGPYRPADEDVLADAVDSGRRALLHGTDARAAVIACYAAMETSLAHSGIARRASDSPQDLLVRAAGHGLLSGPHASDLTALFREARYSTHPMDHTHRERAAFALDAIAAQLAERAEAEPAAADGTPPSGGAARGDGTQGPRPASGAHR